MYNCLITPYMLCREILRICGSGCIGVDWDDTVDPINITIVGLGRDAVILSIPKSSLTLSLDDFADRYLYQIIPEGKVATFTDCLGDWARAGGSHKRAAVNLSALMPNVKLSGCEAVRSNAG